MIATINFISLRVLGSDFDWYWLSLASLLTLLHSIWMLTLIGASVWLFTRLVPRNDSERIYTIHLIGLLACTMSIPLALYCGGNNALTWQRPSASVSTTSPTPLSSPTNQSRATDQALKDGEFARDETGKTSLQTGLQNDVAERADSLSEFATMPRVPAESFVFDLNTEGGSDTANTSAWSWFVIQIRTWISWSAPGLSAAYFCGMFGMLIRLVRNIRQCHYLVREAVTIKEDSLNRTLRLLAGRIGCRFIPTLAVSNRIAIPVVVGCWRPIILVPMSMITGLTPQQWEPILLHELAHLRRYDHWVVLWQRVLEAILFFHPTVWAISRQLDQQREHCCDDRVIRFGQSRVAYAESLCAVAQLALPSPTATNPPLSLAATGVGSNQLLERVERILGFPTVVHRRRVPLASATTWPTFVISLVLLLMLLIAGLRQRDPMLGVSPLVPAANRQLDSDEQDKYRIEDCLEMDGDDVVMILRGVVLMPDGTPAQNLVAAPTDFNLSFENPSVRIDGHRFEVRTKGMRAYWRFKTADGLWQAEVQVPEDKLRAKAMSGIELTLRPVDPVPTWRIPVLVTHDGQPVAGAQVQLHGVRSETDADGNAFLEVIPTVGHQSVVAWRDDRLIGASEALGPVTSVDTASEFDGRTIHIELTRARPLKLSIVDENSEPVAGLSLQLRFRTDNNSNSFSADILEELVTDSEGQVVTRWCPDWPTGRLNVLNGFRLRCGTQTREGINNFQTVANLAGLDELRVQVKREQPRIVVTGKLKLDVEAPGGFLIEAYCSQVDSIYFDVVQTWTAHDGTFRFAALEGKTYEINVKDERYVAVPWRGPVYATDEVEDPAPELYVREGIPVEITCTAGTKKVALAGATLSCTTRPNGISPRLGRRIYVETDAQGVAKLWSPPGELSVYLESKKQVLEKNFKVREDRANQFSLHLDSPETATFSGRLSVPAEHQASIAGATIHIMGNSPQDATDLTIRADETGRFEFHAGSEELAFFAETKDGKWSVSGVLQPETSAATLELLPSLPFRGVLVDENGTPIAGAKISFIGTLASTKFGQRTAGSQLTSRHAETTEDGSFVIETLPPNVNFSLARVDQLGITGHTSIATGSFLGHLQLRPGEARPIQTLVSSSSASQGTK